MTVEQADLDLTISQFVNLIEAFRQEIHSRLEIIDHTLSAMEKQNAIITVALGEQGALLEGLLTLINPESEDYTKFATKVKESKKAMLEALQKGAAAIDGEDSQLSTALADMVKGM